MTVDEFHILSNDLQNLAEIIPLNWGKIQNDISDGKIKMFEINSYSNLENQITNLNLEDKNYFRKRWFLWKCSQCDEYLFNLNENVKPNSNSKSKQYDVEFNNNLELRFDIKGTLVPKEYRKNINLIISNPKIIVDFFYNNQSTGIRSCFQNRIFIVHHSMIEQKREMLLRCNWNVKEKIFKTYSNKINFNSKFINYKDVKADVIFIIENSDGSIYSKICSV